MSDFNALLEKFENGQGEPAQEVVTHEPESGSAPVVTQEPVVTESVIPAAEPVVPVAETNNVEIQQLDYNKFLEESSGGLFKTVDEFKNSLTKITEYDQLKAKAEQDPFANPLVKQYNELVKSNKSQDQIDSFFRINQLGDLTQLTPFQRKVEAMVQDGYKRDFAERKITRDFNLNIEISGDHLTDEQIESNKLLLADAEEDLRVSSEKDLEKLELLKIKLAEPNTDNADNKALAEVAQKKEYNSKLQPVVLKIAETYNGLGNLNVNGATDDTAKIMSFEVDPEFKVKAEKLLFDHFKDGLIPVNDETVAEAKQFLDAQWLVENKEKFARMNYNQGFADAKLKADDEFENKSGLPTSGLPPVTASGIASVKEQQRRVAMGEDD